MHHDQQGNVSVCTHHSVSPSHLHGAVAEELLDVFSRTGCGHALGVGATDVPIGKSEEGGTAVKKENHLNTHVQNECGCMCTWSCVSPTPFYFIYCVVLFVLECFYDERMEPARIALFFNSVDLCTKTKTF